MESGRPHREPSRSGRTAALGVTLSDYRSLTVRDCLGTLLAFLRKYKGSARASFEGDGDLLFSACDNFHPDATVVSHEVPEGWLQQLQSAGLFEVAEARR